MRAEWGTSVFISAGTMGISGGQVER
jgi:hypothetical protein